MFYIFLLKCSQNHRNGHKNAESVLRMTVIAPKLWNFNSTKDNADNLTNINSLTLTLHMLSEYYSAPNVDLLVYLVIQIVKNTHAKSVEDVYYLSTKSCKEAQVRYESSEWNGSSVSSSGSFQQWNLTDSFTVGISLRGQFYRNHGTRYAKENTYYGKQWGVLNPQPQFAVNISILHADGKLPRKNVVSYKKVFNIIIAFYARLFLIGSV